MHIPGVNERVKLMTQNQWMKGCPEGGEQGFLFSLYSQLIEGKCVCPSGCGYSITRIKSHFFAICVSSSPLSSPNHSYSSGQSSFEIYIEYLRGIVRQKCEKCLKKFCLACGEPINGPSPRSQESAKGSNDPDLFHCSNLQGVILGVGLALLEQLYHDQLQNPLGPENKVRTSKRRKTDPVINTSMILDPDDDDDSYLTPPAQGKKPKVGIGYAGDQKEDVSGRRCAL